MKLFSDHMSEALLLDEVLAHSRNLKGTGLTCRKLLTKLLTHLIIMFSENILNTKREERI